MRATVVDRLLPMLEAYASGRVQAKGLRRDMRALVCAKADEDVHQGTDRCYRIRDTANVGDCRPCAARRVLWLAFAERRVENKRLLGRIERLALRLSLPDPVEPEEPKPLLDLMRAAGIDAPLAPCECGCGKMVPGGLLEAAHEEDYRFGERGCE